MLARAVASLDILSGGRAELGLGAGAFWDAIAALGGPRRTPRESVEALEEAIDVIRALWDVDAERGARVDGAHYRLEGAKPGPAPLHEAGIWLGAYKPRMLELVGRKADGWLPSLPYLQPGDLQAGNARIDRAARAAGRDPSEIRRLLNVGADQTPEDLARLAVEDRIDTLILMADDAGVDRAPRRRDRAGGARAGRRAARRRGRAGRPRLRARRERRRRRRSRRARPSTSVSGSRRRRTTGTAATRSPPGTSPAGRTGSPRDRT